MYYGKNIKFLRTKKGWDQSTLANEIGKSRAVISSYERGDSEPPLSVFVKIAELFKVSLDDLVYINMEDPKSSGTEKNPSNVTYLSEEKFRAMVEEQVNNYLKEKGL